MNAVGPFAVRRRAVLGWFGSLGVAALTGEVGAAGLDASEKGLPTASDLRAHWAMARARREPLVVLASLHGCPFCKVARENYWIPAMKEGAVVVQMDFLSKAPVIGWDGVPTTHGNWVKALAVSVAPTVLFFGRDGEEVAPRLVGGSTSDFYGAYVDERLLQARQAVRR